MDKLYSPSTINQIKELYNFKLSKSLGQNFLVNNHIVTKIVEGSLIGENDLVIEIGPGVGVLTSPCAEIAKKVIAIEIDKHLIPILKDTLKEFDNVEVINVDFLKFDLVELLEKEKPNGYDNVRIIGNLPYYITTPIIMKILEEKVKCNSVTIMVQKEVAARMCAKAGKKEYGAITVAVNYYSTVEQIVQVPKTAFYPSPNVDSSVIRFDIRKTRIVEPDDEEVFFKVIKASFGQRRKTLLNSISTIENLSKVEALEALNAVEIDPMRRGETLTIFEFSELSNAIAKIQKNTI
jgi:16S rRNA (adenine1518-N6/adenine1519-N6)-dimethyltransferase